MWRVRRLGRSPSEELHNIYIYINTLNKLCWDSWICFAFCISFIASVILKIGSRMLSCKSYSRNWASVFRQAEQMDISSSLASKASFTLPTWKGFSRKCKKGWTGVSSALRVRAVMLNLVLNKNPFGPLGLLFSLKLSWGQSSLVDHEGLVCCPGGDRNSAMVATCENFAGKRIALNLCLCVTRFCLSSFSREFFCMKFAFFKIKCTFSSFSAPLQRAIYSKPDPDSLPWAQFGRKNIPLVPWTFWSWFP